MKGEKHPQLGASHQSRRDKGGSQDWGQPTEQGGSWPSPLALCSLMARPSPWLSWGPWAVAGGMAQLPKPPGARLQVAPGNPAESKGALGWGAAAQRRSQRVPTSVHRTEAAPPRAWHHVNAATPPSPPPLDWLLVLGKELRFSSAGYLLFRRAQSLYCLQPPGSA